MKVAGNERGMTIIYVIAALLLALSCGSGLMAMAAKEGAASADIGALESAHLTAESGVVALETLFADSVPTLQLALRRYLDTGYHGVNKGWLMGSANAPLVLSGQEKYSARIVGFDVATFTMAVRIDALGRNGARKSARVLYTFPAATIPFTSPLPTQALYLGSGNHEINGNLTVNGNTWIGNGFTDNNTAGKVFNGTFVGAGPASSTISAMTFNGPAYFGGPVRVEDRDPVFNAGVAFGSSVDNTSSKDIMINNGRDAWFNSTYGVAGGHASGWITMSGAGTVHVRTGVNGAHEAHNEGSVETSAVPYVNLKTKVGIPESPPPALTVDLSGIPGSLIFSCEQTSGIIRDHVSAAWWNPNGKDLSDAYTWARSNGKLWQNRYLVIRTNSSNFMWANRTAANKNFTGHLIWIVNSSVTVGSQMFDVPAGSSCLFHVDNNAVVTNFGGYDAFNGFVYCKRGEIIYMATRNPENLRGAIYHTDDGEHTQNTNGGRQVVNYDAGVLGGFADAGLFTLGGGSQDPGEITLTEPLVYRMASLSF